MSVGTGRVLLEGIGTNKEQWLALRAGKVSSTTITSIVGVNPHKSAYQLWAEWTGKVRDDFSGNEYTELGTLLEPYVGSLYARRTGRDVRASDTLYSHKDLDWAVATPDFVVGGEELLEAKTGTIRQLPKWADEETPDHYLVQLVWQMGVCGVKSGHIAALLGADPTNFVTRSFELDYELFNALLEAGHDFLDCVRRDDPPMPNEKDGKLILELVKRNASTKLFTAEQTEKLGGLFDELVELRERKATLDDESRQLDGQIKCRENALRVALGDSGDGAFADGRRYRVKRISVPERIAAAYEYERLYILNGGRG
jgi:putative phage-type endonuclease